MDNGLEAQGEMTIKVDTMDPGAAGIRQAVDRCKRIFPSHSEAIGLYGEVLEVQQEALSGVACSIDFSALDIAACLKRGQPLLDPGELDLDLHSLRDVLASICSVVERRGAMRAGGCKELLEWDGLAIEGFRETRARLLGKERLEPGDMGMEGFEAAQAAGIIWESLVPFYRKCAQGLQDSIDHSLWQKGRCPICGMGPLMGKLQSEDGLWLLECRLCHTLWNVRRATCPFCPDGEQGSLEYIYLEDHASYRAYYCSRCKRYIKTSVLRSAQVDTVLPLENLITQLLGLDQAAEREGLSPA
jgi:formate dehydrogenase maturation protein FdhE